MPFLQNNKILYNKLRKCSIIVEQYEHIRYLLTYLVRSLIRIYTHLNDSLGEYVELISSSLSFLYCFLRKVYANLFYLYETYRLFAIFLSTFILLSKQTKFNKSRDLHRI